MGGGVMEPVVVVFPTIMSGQVVRWYRHEQAANNHSEMASASREGVMVAMAPREVAIAAYDAHERLRAERAADLSHLATHKYDGLFGMLVPIETVSSGGDAA